MFSREVVQIDAVTGDGCGFDGQDPTFGGLEEVMSY